MKTKAEILRALAQTKDDHILLSQVLDKLDACRTRSYPVHTRFLDLRERTLTVQALRLAGGEDSAVLYGGYADAERAAALFYPEYLTAEQMCADAPFAILRAKKHPSDTLSHRDYLGALMGLGIERGCVGDILVHEDGADFIVLADMADFILLNFEKAGRGHLKLTHADALRTPQAQGETQSGSVASLRLDSVCALVFNISRSEAQEQIARGQVFLNFMQCMKNEREIAVGDRITLRGHGRARILSLGGTSRKGRQVLAYCR